MHCNNCGVKLKEGAKFCNECGTKVVSKTDNTNKSDCVMPINKSKAIASLILGILSFVIGVILLPIPLIGLILGIKQKEKCGEKTAGIVLNSIALSLSALLWIFIFLMIFVTTYDNDNEYKKDNYDNSDVTNYNDNDNDKYLDDIIDILD